MDLVRSGNRRPSLHTAIMQLYREVAVHGEHARPTMVTSRAIWSLVFVEMREIYLHTRGHAVRGFHRSNRRGADGPKSAVDQWTFIRPKRAIEADQRVMRGSRPGGIRGNSREARKGSQSHSYPRPYCRKAAVYLSRRIRWFLDDEDFSQESRTRTFSVPALRTTEPKLQ